MKTQDQRKYCLEQFKKMLPSLNQLIEQVCLTDKPEKYNILYLLGLLTSICGIILYTILSYFSTDG